MRKYNNLSSGQFWDTNLTWPLFLQGCKSNFLTKFLSVRHKNFHESSLYRCQYFSIGPISARAENDANLTFQKKNSTPIQVAGIDE